MSVINNMVNAVKIGGKAVGGFVTKNSPTLLTALGIGGMALAVVAAVHETKFVDQDLKNLEKEELHEVEQSESKEIKHPIMPRAKIYAKNYWPAAAIFVSSSACLIFAQKIQYQRTAAALAAYQLSAMNLKDLKEKIVQVDGDKKLKTLTDDIAKDKVDKSKSEAPSKEVYFVGDSEDSMFFDIPSGRYFKSNIEKVRRAAQSFNESLWDERFATLNDWYSFLDIPEIKGKGNIGSGLGWILDDGGNPHDDMLHITYSSQLMENGHPCTTIDYELRPIMANWSY